MSNIKIKLDILSDVSALTEIAIRNGYKVTSIPVYEPYCKTKIDYFKVTLESIEELKEQAE